MAELRRILAVVRSAVSVDTTQGYCILPPPQQSGMFDVVQAFGGNNSAVCNDSAHRYFFWN